MNRYIDAVSLHQIGQASFGARHRSINMTASTRLAALFAATSLLLGACGAPHSVSDSDSSHTDSLCQPAPCLATADFKLTVTSIDRNVAGGVYLKPDAGDHYITMKVTLRNMSSKARIVNQSDFLLRDASGKEHGLAFAPVSGCEMWQPVNVATGTSLPVEILPGDAVGPKDLCFQAFGPPNAQVVLVWSSSFLGKRLEIPS